MSFDDHPPTYVLVHGAWHGAWCWRGVEELLVANGAKVSTPTLSGLGDKAHLPLAEIGLFTHIADVVAHLRTEELRNVTLVGHSYSELVATAAAVLEEERISKLVIVDGFLPRAGERWSDLLPDRAAAHYWEALGLSGGVSIAPRPVANLGVTDPDLLESIPPRLTPQPGKTFTEATRWGLDQLNVPGRYLLADGWNTVFGPAKQRAIDAGWSHRDLDGDHELMLTDPKLLAEALIEIHSPKSVKVRKVH